MTGNRLTDKEVRVLGTLIEKEATTPEYYPLTLNALVNGCNQRSNREPVVSYSPEEVSRALEGLRAKQMVLIVSGSGRVEKYAQRLSETLNLGRRETAVLCVLFLRGAQTPGEIKDRAERQFSFEDLPEVERILQKLNEAPGGPMVVRLDRQPGQKESRYAHLFAGEPALQPTPDSDEPSEEKRPSKLSQLEDDLLRLRGEFDELKNRFERLESQLQ